MLVVQLLLLPSICNKLLYYIKIHKRLAAKEIHFQIAALSGIGNQKIQCLLTGLKIHKRAPSVVLALFRKTIFAGEIAVMCDMQAQRLDYRLMLLKINNMRLVNIFGEKLLIRLQCLHFVNRFQNLLL